MKKDAARVTKPGRRSQKGQAVTGSELKGLQVRLGLSDTAFLKRLGVAVTSTTRRRLRRWKLGEILIPDAVAEAARLVDGKP